MGTGIAFEAAGPDGWTLVHTSDGIMALVGSLGCVMFGDLMKSNFRSRGAWWTAALLGLSIPLHAAEWHVSVAGDDAHEGSAAQPFQTISAAARVAQPGDTITVHAGIYRERVDPPRGGTATGGRIVYQAAPGEKVIITGAERITSWTKVAGDVWTVKLPNTYFGGFNPYRDTLRGDWYVGTRPVHPGAVYLNGAWLTEADSLDRVLDPQDASTVWFARVDKETTTIWAKFGPVDPNRELVEINVRQTVFYPSHTGINDITVRGFVLEQAATPWAPPTAEQIGVIGPHWSKGWIIENNVVRFSSCAGISLGKYGDAFDNTGESAEGYVGTIKRAVAFGWTKETVGHHLVRHNDISHCEQAGIVGSLGAVFSTIEDNEVHDIHERHLFDGAEMAGIKIHGAVDVVIARNHVYRCWLGLWLDWMAQGARVTANLCEANGSDLVLEVNHGPILVDNNLFLSVGEIQDKSNGVAFAHNLFAGKLAVIGPDGRSTPYFKAHSLEIAGYQDIPKGDVSFYNNVFVRLPDLTCCDDATLPVAMDGNVYLDAAKPSKFERNPVVQPNAHVEPGIVRLADGVDLEMKSDAAWNGTRHRSVVDTARLGRPVAVDEAYESANGKALVLDHDYFGTRRDPANPKPGPFAKVESGEISLKVWPRETKD